MATNFEDTGATQRNAEDCERIAQVLRPLLGCGEGERVPPISAALNLGRANIPQLKELELVVRSDYSMGRAHAAAVPDTLEIEIRESDVDAIMVDAPKMRFAILHELTHVLLHTGQGKFFRVAEGNVVHSFLGHDNDRAEWQADRVARAILMPREMVSRAANAHELAQLSGSPLREAIARIKDLTPPKGHTTPQSVVNAISKLKLNAATTPAERAKLEAEDRKLELWSSLPAVAGEDKCEVRLCGKYQIRWSEFGRTTGCGWFIENERIHAHYERYD